MTKHLVLGGLLIASLSAAALAHPFGLRFANRGACEKKMAEINHYDRENVAGPVFGIDNNGQAAVFFLEAFQCEYESSSGMWRIADHRGDDSANGNAWDD